MYDRVLVITINSYYSEVPSTGTAVLFSTVPVPVSTVQRQLCVVAVPLRIFKKLQQKIEVITARQT